MTQSISDRVMRVVASHLECKITDLPDAVTSLEIDSLDQVEIGMGLEDEFDIEEITDEESDLCQTLGDWTELVEAKLAAKAAA